MRRGVQRQNLQYDDIQEFFYKSRSATCEKYVWKSTLHTFKILKIHHFLGFRSPLSSLLSYSGERLPKMSKFERYDRYLGLTVNDWSQSMWEIRHKEIRRKEDLQLDTQAQVASFRACASWSGQCQGIAHVFSKKITAATTEKNLF